MEKAAPLTGHEVIGYFAPVEKVGEVHKTNLLDGGTYEITIPENKVTYTFSFLDDEEKHGFDFVATSGREGWVAVTRGKGIIRLKDGSKKECTAGDLIYIPNDVQASLIPDAQSESLQALMIRSSQEIHTPQTDFPSVIVCHRSQKPVDWVGPWVEGVGATPLHIAREGTSESSPENPLTPPLHLHKKTREIYFVTSGETIIETIPQSLQVQKSVMKEGDLVDVEAGLLHTEGEIKTVIEKDSNGKDIRKLMDQTYKGDFAGLVIKIPIMENEKADAKDKIEKPTIIR